MTQQRIAWLRKSELGLLLLALRQQQTDGVNHAANIVNQRLWEE